MKEIIKNGKKFVVTDSLYKALKNKKLFETDNTIDDPSTPQTYMHPTAGIIKRGITYNDESELNKGEAPEEWKNAFYKEYDDILKNIEMFLNSEDIKEDPSLEKSLKKFYSVMKNYKTKNNDMKKFANQAMIHIARNYGQLNVLKNKKRIALTIFDAFMGNGLQEIIPLNDFRKIQTIFAYPKKAIIGFNNIYQQEYDKIMKYSEKVDDSLPINNDGDETNNIKSADFIEDIFGKKEEKNAIKNYIKRRYGDIAKLSQEELSTIIRQAIKLELTKIKSGEHKINNDEEKLNSEDYKIMINMFYNYDKNTIDSEYIDNNTKLKNAVIMVEKICDDKGWDDKNVDIACKEAAKKYSISDSNDIKKLLLDSKKHNIDKSRISKILDKAERNNEVLKSLKNNRHKVDDELIGIFKNFYEYLFSDDISSTPFFNDISNYINKYSYFLNEYVKKQDYLTNFIENNYKNFSNVDIIFDIISELNKNNGNKYIKDASELNSLVDDLKNSTVKEEEVKFNMEQLQNADYILSEIYSKKMPKVENDDSKDINKDNFGDLFKKYFSDNNSIVKQLLESYDIATYCTILKLAIIQGMNYVNKHGNGYINAKSDISLSSVIQLFRYFMGRSINDDDIELYKEIFDNLTLSKNKSESFIKKLKELYNKIYTVTSIRIVKKLKLKLTEFVKYSIDLSSNGDNEKYDNLKKVAAYCILSDYANKNPSIYEIEENTEDLEENNNWVKIMIAKIVPQDDSKQVSMKLINEMNYQFGVMDFENINKLYTAATSDKFIKANYIVISDYQQEAFNNFTRPLIVNDKENNFVSIVKIYKILGKTRGFMNQLGLNSRNANRLYKDIGNKLKFY